MFLEVQPVYTRPGYVLTQADIAITNTLHRLLLEVTSGKKHIAAQVAAASIQRGAQPVPTFTGNRIDEDFKRRVRQMQSSGALPKQIEIAKPRVSPDLWFGRIGWDVTTAEQGRHHSHRDVRPDPERWDAYFVLGY